MLGLFTCDVTRGSSRLGYKGDCTGYTSMLTIRVSSEQVEVIHLVHKICCENISAFYEVAIIGNFFKSHVFVKTASWKLALPVPLSNARSLLRCVH